MKAALYVDASAVVKRFKPEHGTQEAVAAMDEALALCASRITYTEVARALVGPIADADAADAVRGVWREAWTDYVVIDIDQPIAEHAASLATYHGLKSLDAIHLASALALPSGPLRFATWDRRLWDAARAVGLRTVPVAAP